MVARKRVFLSVGRRESKKHVEFVNALKSYLENRGLDVFTLPNTFSNPLAKVIEEMKQCDGAVVVCFERIYAERAQEFRDAKPARPPIEPLRSPTVWNHVEAAIAKSLDLPVLILAENGCRADGMLDGIVQFKVQWLDFETKQLALPHITQVFDGWVDAMELHARDKEKNLVVDPSKLKFIDILRSLRMSDAAAIFVTMAAIFTAGWWFGTVIPYE